MAQVTVQTNLSLGQLGRCFARIARKSGAPEINLRAAMLGEVRCRKGTGAYALEVLPYGLLICRTGTAPVPENMGWQANPAFLRSALKAVQQWADARKVTWPRGRFEARRDFGLSGWPPNPEEIEADRRRQPVVEPPESVVMATDLAAGRFAIDKDGLILVP